MGTILIVEDYPVMQRVLSLTLRNNGYEVLIAGNGLEAIALLEQSPVDLALVDIAMPEMDGLALLRHLREDPRFQSLPIIMLTASGQDDDRALALSIGANGFLSKPASSQQLIETVGAYVAAGG